LEDNIKMDIREINCDDRRNWLRIVSNGGFLSGGVELPRATARGLGLVKVVTLPRKETCDLLVTLSNILLQIESKRVLKTLKETYCRFKCFTVYGEASRNYKLISV
jgi:hypothetical protein